MAEFKCSQCDKIMYSEEALQQHISARHARQEAGKSKRKIKTSYIALIVIILLVAGGIWLASGMKSPTYTPRTEPTDKFIGDLNANVTLLEYSDYECPFCARFDTQTEPQIISDYVNAGKVKIVFKNFPLAGHANSEKAAEAAECAYDIGGNDLFWKMHDIMFKNTNLLTTSNLKKYAGQLGINTTEFNACLDSGAMRPRVQLDLRDGQSAGVTSTPIFFVYSDNMQNAQIIEGAQTFATFQAAIESKLTQVTI